VSIGTWTIQEGSPLHPAAREHRLSSLERYFRQEGCSMKVMHALVMASLATAPDAGSAAARRWFDASRCTTRVALQAMGSVNSAQRDWRILRGHFEVYGSCDQGPVAEGYSQNVVALLTRKWKLLPELEELGRTDPGFLEFVLAHIDATTDGYELETVRRNAERSCRPSEAKLCREIAAQAKSALEERNALRRRE